MGFRIIFLVVCTCLVAVFSLPVSAARGQLQSEHSTTGNIQKVRWAITEWQGLTNRDGTGVYHEVVLRAFTLSNIAIEYDYVPLKRAIDYVKLGKADMTGGLDTSEEFLQPRYPINSSRETAFFRKGTLSPDLSYRALERKSGVWLLGYTDAFPSELKTMLTGNAVSTRDIAFAMVLNNRAEYYLDNDFQMNTLLKDYSGDADLNQFTRFHLISLPLFMSFTNNQRGQVLVKYYEQGIEHLMKTGELQDIYARWNLEFPLNNEE